MGKEVLTMGGQDIQIRIGASEECWKTLAKLIAKRAGAIYQRRSATAEEGMDLWELAESQVEKPLCCGILKLDDGCLITLNSAEMGTSEIELCAEPRRLILLGRNRMGGTGKSDAVVRVLRLPDEVDPGSLTFRQEGAILDIELRNSKPREEASVTATAA
jgi:HSP20 family molecular chaperone IbpA